MFNKFIETYSANLWEFLKPRALVESIHACLRVLADKLSGGEAVNNTDYNPNGTASIGLTVSIPVTNIQPASAVAGVDTTNPTDIAGKQEYPGYLFFVYGLPENMVMIGKAPDAKMAMLFTDFIPHGNGYLFKDLPTNYGTVSNQDGSTVISFYVVGGQVENKHQPQFRLLYDKTSSNMVYDSVKHNVTKSLMCAGVSNVAAKASAGIAVSETLSKIDKMWKEGNTVYGVTDSSLLQCPAELADTLLAGTVINAGDDLSKERSDSILVFPVGKKWYFLDSKFPIYSSALPNLSDEYPEVVSDTSFELLFNQLKALMKERHIGTITVPESVKFSGMDYDLLYRGVSYANSLHIVKRVYISLPYTSQVSSESSVSSGEMISNEDIDTLYVFYTNSADIPTRVHCAGASSLELLKTHYNSSGCWRVTDCLNSGNFLYGLTSNSTIFGNKPEAVSKIYGIALVRGGNTYKEDVVYRYSSVPVMPVGTGVEAAIECLLV